MADRRWWLTLVVALGTLLAPGCFGENTTCPDEWAPSVLGVRVEGAGLEAGTWMIDVDDISCEIVLPEEQSTCTVPPRFMILDGEDVLLTLFEYAPATVYIAVFHDSALVFNGEVRPSWTEDEPNGHGCGIQREAEVLVPLD